MQKVLAAFLPEDLLIEMVAIGTLTAFVLVCLAVIVLRKTHPNVPRPFKVPLMPWVPIGGMAVCAFMIYGLPLDTKLRWVVWFVLGMGAYFLYARKNAKTPSYALKRD